MDGERETVMKIGQKYKFTDLDGGDQEVLIIGYDPNEGKWVGSCKDWVMGISHIDEEDIGCMTLVLQNEREVK